MALTKKRKAFIEHYLQTWNASEAARRAGYSARTAGSIGHDLLKIPEIQDAIQERLAELKMDADEVLLRLAEIARLDLTPYIVTEHGRPYVDVKALKDDGKGHLINELYYDASGNLRVKFKDSQSALVKLGDAHRLFANRTEVTGADGGPVTLRVVYADDDA